MAHLPFGTVHRHAADNSDKADQPQASALRAAGLSQLLLIFVAQRAALVAGEALVGGF